MPVWHASISIRSHDRQIALVGRASLVARYIAALALHGVGSDDGEWWISRGLNGVVAHLRVATTPDEQLVTGEGLAEFDAGETGTYTKGRVDPATLERKLT